MRVLLFEQGKVLEAADQRRESIGRMLRDPQDLPQQQKGSGKRRKRLVEAADLLAHPAAFDLEQGGSVVLPKNKMAVITGRKMEILGVLPVRAWDLG